MTLIQLSILLIQLAYLIDMSKGLFGISFVVVYFLFILAMAFWLKPLQRIFKVSQAIEVIVWFSLLFLYASLFVLLNF